MQLEPREILPKVKEKDGFIDSGNQRYSTRIARELLDTALDKFPSDPTGTLDTTLQKQGAVASPEEHVQDSESFEGAQNQLVIYSPGAGDAGEIVPVPEPNEYQPPPHHSSTSNPSKVLPSIGAFAVQCAACFKWRLIPTKEKYEEIRENILQQLFTCEAAQEWQPDISCDDPADISQDGSRLWAIDIPNIAQPPPGWERLLRIRGEGSTKFADVYYVAPSGKRLRSMVEVEKYLFEHPEYTRAGVNMSKFSFRIPKPLQENYVRKRPSTKMSRRYDGNALDMPQQPLEPAEVNPLSWISPDEHSDLPLPHGQGKSSTPYFEAPFLQPHPPSVKKRATRRPSTQVYSSPA